MNLPPPASNLDRFVAGYLFAGRYRIVTRLGQGAFAEVWQADDLTLGIPVALKLVRSKRPAQSERIIAEARLARRITHPSVCRVFDVGEAENELFYSMELIVGEDLATVLRRAGRLSSETVAGIGRQLCEGLAAAHAQGVLHWNLNLTNVLIDDNGAVRITEFGETSSADTDRADTGHHQAQDASGVGGSEQADIYAAGLILYQLLSGRPAFADGSERSAPPTRLASIVPGIDPQLDRIVFRMLAVDARQRPRSAAVVAADLARTGSMRERQRVGPWIAAAAIAATVAGLAVFSSTFVSRRAPALTGQDTIVIADFMNTTGDAVFDGTLNVALAVALEQSPFLKVYPQVRLQETLGLMQRPPNQPVTRDVAQEIARRERLNALIAGSIAGLGAHYVLTLEAINAESGDTMAREQVEAASKEEVLASLGTAAAALRERLGESLASIRRFDAPLPRATTASLEALHAYSLALDEGRVVPRVEAIPYLQRALELDPNFAMAQALLSGVYANTGRSADAPVYSRRAFELRDRVTERERFFISWRYFIDAAQAWDRALELARSWTETYPREAFAFNSLGLASGAFGLHDQAVQAFREAIRLDDRFIPPYGNLVGSLMALNRFDDAREGLRQAAGRRLDFITLRRMAFLLALVGDDENGMAQELRDARSMPQSMWPTIWEARTAAFGGRFAAADDLFREGAEAALRDDLRELAAQWTMEGAESQAIAGNCAGASREAARGLELSRDNFTLERASRTLALCGEAAQAGALTADIAKRYPDATLSNRLQVPVTTAALHVAHHEPGAAIRVLEAVKSYDHAPAAEFWPSYLRGQALLELKDGAAARAEFQTIVDHRGGAPTSPLYALAHLGLARALMLGGDAQSAREAYQTFLTLWDRADSTVPDLEAARREYERLR